MNIAKKIFIQSMIISTSILFLNGILAVFAHLGGKGEMVLQWYHPISIVLVGFFCALPTALLENCDSGDRKRFGIRVALHCLALYAAVMGAGRLFGWYRDARGFAGVSVVFLLVYAFVWLSGLWLDKQDEKKINHALDAIRDRE